MRKLVQDCSRQQAMEEITLCNQHFNGAKNMLKRNVNSKSLAKIKVMNYCNA